MPLTSIPGFTPYGDFSPLADIPKAYWEGQDRAQAERVRQAFINGLPRGPGGVIDYGEAANRVAQLGGDISPYVGFSQAEARNKLAAATLANTQRHEKIMEAIAGRGITLQEEQAKEKPQYQNIEGVLYEILPRGGG